MINNLMDSVPSIEIAFEEFCEDFIKIFNEVEYRIENNDYSSEKEKTTLEDIYYRLRNIFPYA